MPAAQTSRKLPPMLRQYQEYKHKYPDCLLLFQVGDFYEAFFEDAVTVSQALNLTLTSRDKNTDDPIPMAGVPVAVVDNYMERLVNAGYSVALVSQSEPPTGKGMVARKLDRIVTPGIKLLSAAEDQGTDSVVAALSFDRNPSLRVKEDVEVSVAFTDVQTGEIALRDGISLSSLGAEMLRIAAREVILPRSVDNRQVDRRAGWYRDLEFALKNCTFKFRNTGPHDQGDFGLRSLSSIEGFSSLGVNAKKAVRLLVDYIDEITVDTLMPISKVGIKNYSDVLILDATTRTNLELVKNLKDGGLEGTLLEVLNYTRTLVGFKLLKQWILNPLTDLERIRTRTAAVRSLVKQAQRRTILQDILRYMTNFERIAARIELGLVSPRELGALRDAAERFPEIKKILSEISREPESESLRLISIEDELEISGNLLTLLQNALVDNPPSSVKEGGIIRAGYNDELDRLFEMRIKGKSWIAELEARERAATGISSLKIKFNNVHGYFLEVTKANADKVPQRYLRKQTMTNAERFYTEELKKLEEEVLGAEEKQRALEQELFCELKEKVVPYSADIRRISRNIAQLDVFLSLAELADREGFTEAQVSNTSGLMIKKGRHPVIARLLQGSFVPNSIEFQSDGCSCFIITGANMGGKSTYLRQIGLIVIMAQMGSFVPAAGAEIGMVDKVFARIGASDDLLEGESTFMVEMREAAHIVSNATERSLLLIDEIGRGTATSDGLAIAQAILEWIVLRIKCRTLFATHFHELTLLEEKYPFIENYSVGSVDRGGTVIFTHEIQKGPANKSYGLEVALLAGLPETLVDRARGLLKELDVDDLMRASSSGTPADCQLSIFDQSSELKDNGSDSCQEDSQEHFRSLEQSIEVSREPSDYKRLKEVGECIEEVDVNDVTPLEALNLLSSLKSSLRDQDPE
jgi:DNA mismatch repair protein MutS